jgi:putative ABC transport system permease protein
MTTTSIAANTYLQAVGRLRKGVTFEQGRADVAAVFDRLAREFPETNAETGFSYFRQRDFVLPQFRLMLLALTGASLCMLLLTCANLANLLLARAASRERELAVRASLGAGRERLVRQMLTESVVLAMMGAVAGVFAAALAMPLLSRLVPPTMPLASAPVLDVRVFVIAAVFSLLTDWDSVCCRPSAWEALRVSRHCVRVHAAAGGGSVFARHSWPSKSPSR